MKALLNKKVAILLLTVFALAFSLSAVANGPSVAGEGGYDYDVVVAGCEAAWDHPMQVQQCITNICSFYGCNY